MDTEGQLHEELADDVVEPGQQNGTIEHPGPEAESGSGAAHGESELLLGTGLFDGLGALVVILDPEGRVRSFNRACQQVSGFSLEEARDKYIWDLMVAPEGVSTVKAVFENLRDGQFSVEHESHLLTRDGSRRLIAWSHVPLVDSQGEPEHVIGVGIAIREREETDEALRKSEDQYRRLVESSPDAIIVHYRGKIVFVNRAAVTLLGASGPEQVIGKPVVDFVHPDYRAAVKERLQKIVQQGTELPLIEDKLLRLDGSVVHVEAHSIFPFLYEDKPAVQVVAHDVTEVRQGAEALWDARQMYDTLVKISSDAVTVIDLRGRITDVSPRALRLHGFESAGQLIGRRIFELVAPEHHEKAIGNLQRSLTEGVLRDVEYTLLRKDGSRFRGVVDTALIRDAHGRPKGFVRTTREVRGQQAVAKAAAPGAARSRPQTEETSALLEASRAMLRHRDFERAARAVFDSCRRVIGARAGYVGLMNEDATRDEILFSESDGVMWTVDDTQATPIRGLRAEAYLAGEPIYLNDLSGNDWPQEAEEGQRRVNNVLFVPLVIEGEPAGLLGLANKPGGFAEDDVDLASVFGELIAVALADSRRLEDLEASEERFRSVAEIADDAVVAVDSQERIVSWNRGAEAIFGYSADETIGKRLTLMASEGLRLAYERAIDEAASKGGFSILARGVEMVGRRKGGGKFPLELSLASWKTRKGVFLTSIIRDITDRKLAEDGIQLLADHDHLTGLPNRALFRERLSVGLANAGRDGQRLGLIMLDLDHFKEINSTLGFGFGDQLLQAVGDRLTDLVRRGDCVARTGDDEFVLLLPGVGQPEHASKVAEKIITALREPFVLNGREVRMTASMGVVVYPDDGEDIDALMSEADVAMCRAKRGGRDKYVRSAPPEGAAGSGEVFVVT